METGERYFQKFKGGCQLLSDDGCLKIILRCTIDRGANGKETRFYTAHTFVYYKEEDGTSGWYESTNVSIHKSIGAYIKDILNCQDFRKSVNEFKKYNL